MGRSWGRGGGRRRKRGRRRRRRRRRSSSSIMVFFNFGRLLGNKGEVVGENWVVFEGNNSFEREEGEKRGGEERGKKKKEKLGEDKIISILSVRSLLSSLLTPP